MTTATQEAPPPTRGARAARGRSGQPSSSDGGGGGGGSGLERVTVNLTPRSAEALEGLTELTRESKTDSINRALQVYAYLQRVLADGGKLYIRDNDQAELERLRFL
jgi:hypothetical protein